MGKQAKLSMCLYNRILGLNESKCNDSAVVSTEGLFFGLSFYYIYYR